MAMKIRLTWIAVAFFVSPAVYSQTTLYEGARLIIGDATPAIEDGAFLVQNGRITAIGKRGSLKAPAGTAHVELTGKTVMPTMNNVHVHIGYEGYVSWSVDNHSPENILDHLEREAFYGIGTTMTMGDQPDDFAIKFQQDQMAGKFPPAARFFFAAGLAPPGGGPDALLIQGTNALHAVHEVSTPEEAVAAVRALAEKNITQVKFWVDNRDNNRGARKKMPPEVFRALINEAHQHGMTVHAHATALEDQKDVVNAGVDVLVHTIVNQKIDEEFIAILKEKRPYWAPVLGLGEGSEICEPNNSFIEQVLPESVIAEAKAGKTWLPSRPCSAVPNPQAMQREENLKYNFPRYITSGARLVLSTDSGLSQRHSFGFGDHQEIGIYARLGLSPSEIIVAVTSRPAEVLHLKDTGTLARDKRADFIVLNANPLDDIHALREIDAVYLAGVKLDRAALQAKFKKALVDRDIYQAKTRQDYVPHPPSSRKPE